MYKGYKRKVIVVKDTGSRLFDSAYFVVRDGVGEEKITDMVSEASRIINEKAERERCPVALKRFFSFLLGAAVASVIFATVVAILG